jgi:hypothetical protein
MVGACSMHRNDEKRAQNFVGKPEGRITFG